MSPFFIITVMFDVHVVCCHRHKMGNLTLKDDKSFLKKTKTGLLLGHSPYTSLKNTLSVYLNVDCNSHVSANKKKCFCRLSIVVAQNE